ncbi:hypothetical protein SteCoe_32351 [Stentor coeruleus]|uniref:C2H2-type domain-containing protein n=1 Tax=Stentor coeruleus TaxID=5963 RepID=A0A1R2AZM3_9CILI|nr:hypothetical protein SteCoe_32351 [Stentor coeruleus]
MDQNLEISSEASTKLPPPHMLHLCENTQKTKKSTCSVCKLVFCNENDFHLHVTLGLPPKIDSPETLATCKECKIEFASFKGMRQHYGKVHLKHKSIKCKICYKLFKNKYAVKFHINQVHEKSTQIVCAICTKLCYNKYSYKTHLLKCSKKSSTKKNQCPSLGPK